MQAAGAPLPPLVAQFGPYIGVPIPYVGVPSFGCSGAAWLIE